MSEAEGVAEERERRAKIATLTAALEAGEQRLYQAMAAVEERDRKLRELTVVQRETEVWVRHLQHELVALQKPRRRWWWWR